MVDLYRRANGKINSFDVYHQRGKIINDPIMYMLYKEHVQDDAKILGEMTTSMQSQTKALNTAVKSKYNLLRQQEPQTIGGGSFVGMANPATKKKFCFER